MNGFFTRLRAISRKELLQLRRDRLTFAMMVAIPVMQLLLFGYAIDFDVRNVTTIVYDQDQTAASRDLARRLELTGSFKLIGAVRSYDEIGLALRSGRARVALVIPPSYGADIVRGRPARAQLVVDGSDPQTIASANGSAAGVAAARSAELLGMRLQALGSRAPLSPVEIMPTTWYNPELRTAVFVVPGLIGIILTMTMIMFTAMALARERERGTLEQLIVSPVRRIELILGKIAPYTIIGYVQMTLILIVGKLVFHVPIVGSIPLLYLLSFLFIAASLAVGLFFSTLAQTQQQAMQMSFFFFLPNILLSGFMFPWEGMPAPMRALSQIFPLTHFHRIARGVTLKGAGLMELSGELLWLAGILGALVLLAALRFRKKLG
jgi:ABC-2 type transport system permease protein